MTSSRVFWSDPRFGLFCILGSGVAAWFYNIVSSSKYDCTTQAASNNLSRIDIRLLSHVVPIIDRSYNYITSSGGNICQATLVRDSYGTDWLICLVGMILALPSLCTIHRIAIDVGVGKLNVPVSENARRGLNIWLFIILVAAVTSAGESWYGWFSTRNTIFVNDIIHNHLNLYRLCLFLPATFLFISLSIISLHVSLKRKTSGYQNPP